MDDYLFFVFYSQGGSSDSPERRGMRGICSTTASVATVRAPFRTPGRDRCQRLPAAPPRRALNPPRRRPRRRPGLGVVGAGVAIVVVVEVVRSPLEHFAFSASAVANA